jgi:membrane protein DedA with SNARE-associated domain
VLAHFGYLAVFLGTFLEGETVLLLAGFAAHRGYLALPGVIACAFAGTLAGDQLYFFLGRSRGPAFLARRPRWGRRVARARELVQRHQDAVILGFRFLYGTRTVVPFVVGMSGVAPWRFAALNAVSAAVWATAIGLVGYAVGESAERLLGEVERYELALFAGLALVGGAVWLLRHRST